VVGLFLCLFFHETRPATLFEFVFFEVIGSGSFFDSVFFKHDYTSKLEQKIKQFWF
jgi:hypothetical protein